MRGGPTGPRCGFNSWANWTHEPGRSTRHSEVLPFKVESAKPIPRASTLALPPSLKAGLERSPSRLRRITEAFRMGLIAKAYRAWKVRTPWDFVGELMELNAWRDCL